jgi:hypothetical protein
MTAPPTSLLAEVCWRAGARISVARRLLRHEFDGVFLRYGTDEEKRFADTFVELSRSDRQALLKSVNSNAEGYV